MNIVMIQIQFYKHQKLCDSKFILQMIKQPLTALKLSFERNNDSWHLIDFSPEWMDL